MEDVEILIKSKDLEKQELKFAKEKKIEVFELDESNYIRYLEKLLKIIIHSAKILEKMDIRDMRGGDASKVNKVNLILRSSSKKKLRMSFISNTYLAYDDDAMKIISDSRFLSPEEFEIINKTSARYIYETDNSTEMYKLGIVIRYFLSKDIEAYSKIFTNDYYYTLDYLSKINKTLGRKIELFLEKCLSFYKSQRYNDYNEFIDDLEEILKIIQNDYGVKKERVCQIELS